MIKIIIHIEMFIYQHFSVRNDPVPSLQTDDKKNVVGKMHPHSARKKKGSKAKGKFNM